MHDRALHFPHNTRSTRRYAQKKMRRLRVKGVYQTAENAEPPKNNVELFTCRRRFHNRLRLAIRYYGPRAVFDRIIPPRHQYGLRFDNGWLSVKLSRGETVLCEHPMI
jgi:hypothetical protein